MLSETKLRDSLLRFFREPGGITSAEDAERRWANCYTSYAADAEDLSGDTATLVNAQGFRAALSFRTIRLASQMAEQLESGFVSYWTGATFGTASLVTGTGTTDCPNVPVPAEPLSTLVFASEDASVVTAVASRTMFSEVLPVLRRNFVGLTAEDQARRIAAAMHRATTSAITVLITGLDTAPGPGPYPLTNTCTIF